MSGKLKLNLGLKKHPENALTVWGIQERARANPERTMVYVLGDVGYQSNGNDLTARTRKWEVEDLLGDKDGETHGARSDWITVDR